MGRVCGGGFHRGAAALYAWVRRYGVVEAVEGVVQVVQLLRGGDVLRCQNLRRGIG